MDFVYSHRHSQFPGRGLCALWAQNGLCLFPQALSIPRKGTMCTMGPKWTLFIPTGTLNSPEGDYVHYGPKMDFVYSHRHSQFPGRGLCALWAQDGLCLFPQALSIPRKGTMCAMGPKWTLFFPIGTLNSPEGDNVRYGPKMDFVLSHRHFQIPGRGQCALWAQDGLCLFP
jgi:hypothetical protein